MFSIKELRYLLHDIKNHYVHGKTLNYPKYMWEDLFEFSKVERILPMVYEMYSPSIPTEYQELFESEYKKHIYESQVVLSHIERISKIATENRIDLVFGKGVILSHLLYGNYLTRSSGDIDTYLEEGKIPEMDKLLRNHGYIQACGKGNPHRIRDKNDLELLPYPILKLHDHHEYFEYYYFYGENGYNSIELQRHIHKSVVDERMYDFLQSNQVISIHNVPIRTFDVEHTFILLCENAYEDSEWFWGGPKLKNFIDIYIYYQKYKEWIETEKFIGLCSYYQVNHVLHKILNYTQHIFDSTISPSFIRLFYTEDPSIPLELDWDVDIVERMLEENSSREKRIIKLLKQQAYSNQNINYDNPFMAQKENNYDYCNNERWLRIEETKYGYNLLYRPFIEQNQLKFRVKIPNSLYISMNMFEIVLSIVGDPQQSFFSKDIKVIKIDNKFVQYFESTKFDITESIKKIECDYMFTITVPNVVSIQEKTVYNLRLEEKIYKNINHIISIGLKHKQFWFSPPVVQINIEEVQLHKEEGDNR
jgi:hypothetical protein